MNEQFRHGSIVRHRTGGPDIVLVAEPMNVDVAWAPKTFTGVWFDRSHNRRSAKFTAEELELVHAVEVSTPTSL